MGSSTISVDPSNLHVPQEDAHPVSKYACKGSKPKLDCQIGTIGEVNSRRAPTDQTPLPRCRSKTRPAFRGSLKLEDHLLGLTKENNMTKPPRDYEAELTDLLRIIREQSLELPIPYNPIPEDADACKPILTWVVESSQGKE